MLFLRVDGNTSGAFALGVIGPQVKSDANAYPALMGALASYDPSGVWYVPFRVGDPTYEYDAVNVRTLECKLEELKPKPERCRGLYPSRRKRRGLF